MAIRRFSTSNLSGTKSSKIWDQETTPGTCESIATVIVPSAGAATVTFSNIPQNYAHLQIRVLGRTNRALTLDQFKINFNSDTASNYYAYHAVYGDGGTAYSGVDTTATYTQISRIPGANATTGVFGAFNIDILDYTSTSKNKTIRTLGGFDTNGIVSSYPGEIWFQSSLWKPTSIAAITQIDIAPISSTAFVQYSHFALYGIRG